jgi:SNF2 family DNA or RNA helicase
MQVTAEIDPAYPDKITLAQVSFHLKELCTSVPGLKYDKQLNNGTWRMPLTWPGCLRLRGTFGENLLIGEALNQWAFEEKTNRIDPCMALREATDAPGPESLYPFQRAGVLFLKTAGQALLADDMGLGKTRQAIATLQEHYRDGTDPFPVLVVCPNSMKYTWKKEFDEVWPDLEIQVIDGNATKRRKQLQEPGHVKIINWEAVRSHSRLEKYGNIALKKCEECGGNDPKIKEATCHVHEKELNRMDFKSVIVDEIHRAIDGKSQQTRAVKYACREAEIRIGLSGTPIANNPADLWSVMNLIAPDEHPGKTDFIDYYIDVSFDMWGVRNFTGIKASKRDEFFATIYPRMRRMVKEAVLKDLPPLVYERRDVPMSPKQAKAYKQMTEQMMAEVEGGDLLIVTSPLQRALRQLQFASSYAEADIEWITDPETGEQKQKAKVTLLNPSNKVDAFMDDLPDFGDKKVVVFAASRQLIELLSEKMEKKSIKHGLITGAIDVDERQRYMDAFQNGKLQYMLCTTGAGGTGITLTAADTAVYLQRPWSMIESEQSEGRVRRIGSEIHDSITIIDYVSSGTIDEVVIEAIEKKSNLLQDILQDEALLARVLKLGLEGLHDADTPAA